MELARFVVEAVILERRSCREVARSYGVSKSWVAVLVSRYRSGGYGAVQPRSRGRCQRGREIGGQPHPSSTSRSQGHPGSVDCANRGV
jgi:hypothetical protein